MYEKKNACKYCLHKMYPQLYCYSCKHKKELDKYYKKHKVRFSTRTDRLPKEVNNG